MFGQTIRRFYSNLKSFQILQELNHYLAANRFSHTLVYFRANWNPNCVLTDTHINKFASENAGVQIIKIDSDVAPKIAKHYTIKAEPQFVFCLYGDQILRQIGPNYEGLNQKLNKMNTMAETLEWTYQQSKWVPYGSRYQAYYQQKLKQAYKAFNSDL